MVSEGEMKALIKDVEPLKLADRCDRCVGQGAVRVMNGKGHILDFCGHHANRFQASLLGAGFFTVEDNRPLIIPEPSLSDEASGAEDLEDEGDIG
jgi:hypothetical protein